MKKAIFTLAMGNNPMYEAAILSFKHYAKKTQSDLIISDKLNYMIEVQNPKYNASPAWAEKLRTSELLKEYDRVLYIDADVLIAPNALDIFNEYPDLETNYLFNEGYLEDRSLEIHSIQEELGFIDWPKINGLPVYYNAGVILSSKGSSLFKIASLDTMQSICNKIPHYDQSYYNHLIYKNNLKHISIDKSFNRMDIMGKEKYIDNNFIHYAGKGFRKNKRQRDVQFVHDFSILYKNIISDNEIKSIRAQAWKEYLLKVYKKYNIPNIILYILCRVFYSQYHEK